MSRKKAVVLATILTAAVFVVSACNKSDEESLLADYETPGFEDLKYGKSSDEIREENNKVNDNQSKAPENSSSVVANQDNKETISSSEGETEQEESEKIKTANEAAKYLSEKLPATNDMAYFYLNSKAKEDEKGSYYLVQQYSKSMREAGGSGSIAIYKVYMNGTYFEQI